MMQRVALGQYRRPVAMALLALGASCATTADEEGDAWRPPVDAGLEAVGRCAPGLASAQFRAEVTPPEFMVPGGRARVSVTFDNCSGAPWPAGEFSLVPAPGTAGAFGVPRVALPADVPDGGRVTIPFEVQAPRESGAYAYSWAIARGGAETLQQYSPPRQVTVQDSADCTVPGPPARFRSQSAPGAFVGLGEAIRGTVTLANCGAETWTRDGGFYLASALPNGQSHWGTARVELPRGDCGGRGTASRFVGQNAPGVMDPNQGADVDITFANCSDAVWDSSYRINAAAPASDGRWGAGNIGFPLDVGPGFRLTVPFRIRAPGDAGNHPYRWVVTRGGTDIAQPSPERTINVRVIDTAGPCMARPVVGNVTSPYGWRVHPISGAWRLHTGIDFGARSGTHIHACRGGTVVRASWYGGYGNAVIIDHGGGMQTLYAHQTGFAVGAGSRVVAGQHIGYVGSTGNSTGAHLHFEVYINGSTVNPAQGYL